MTLASFDAQLSSFEAPTNDALSIDDLLAASFPSLFSFSSILVKASSKTCIVAERRLPVLPFPLADAFELRLLDGLDERG